MNKIKAYVTYLDLGDGSQVFNIVPTKEEAIQKLGYKNEEDFKKKYIDPFESGGYTEVEIEVEEKNGELILAKGFKFDSNQFQYED